MKKTKVIINEEKRFLRLCSQEYKEKIQKKKAMSLNDFNRLYCALTTLQMDYYAMYFGIQLFPELLEQASDEIERDDTDEWFSKEDNLYAYLEQYQQYLYEFWNQMPLKSQRKKYRDLFGIED